MAPQTRSRGQPPASRVYYSSPVLQQVRFPSRRKAVRTYGRQSEDRASGMKQQTLTQIDYLIPTQPDEDVDDSAEMEEERTQPPRKRRRRTEGDADTRNTSRSGFHTQTLTQLPAWKDEGEEWMVKDSEDESEEDADLVAFFGSGNKKEKREGGMTEEAKNGIDDREQERRSRTPSVIPQTPANKRTRFEIPPSNESPTTPMLERYSPAPRNSPLKNKSQSVVDSPLKSTSGNIVGPLRAGSGKRPRNLTIQDSYATTNSLVSTLENPSQKTGSPERNSLEKCSPEEGELRDLSGDGPGLETSLVGRVADVRPAKDASKGETPGAVPETRRRRVGFEIPDSDDESDGSANEPEGEQAEDGLEEDRHAANKYEGAEEVDSMDAMDPAFGPVGEETQVVMEQLVSSSEQLHGTIGGRAPTASDTVSETPTGNSSCSSLAIKATPPSRPISSRSPDTTQTQSQADTSLPTKATDPRPVRRLLQAYTQGFESQRIPLAAIKAMGAQTDRSDIFISLHPQHVDTITAGAKTHEFRNYRIPSTVSRMWIYTTRPACEVRFLASISGAKQPGEIEGEGLGNQEFNKGKNTKFAYEVLQVYELNNPVALRELKERGWLDAAPQKYAYVPPAAVGELMGNLRCALFEDGNADGDDEEFPGTIRSSAPGMVSQELAAQLHSDIVHATQFAPEQSIPSSRSSQTRMPPTPKVQFARPALPPKRGSTQTTTGYGKLRPSQATTVSQASTTSESPEKSVSRPPLPSSSLPILVEDVGSPVRPAPGVVLGSSQFALTKSQVLPDSLLRDDGREVPEIWDSEADDEL